MSQIQRPAHYVEPLDLHIEWQSLLRQTMATVPAWSVMLSFFIEPEGDFRTLYEDVIQHETGPQKGSDSGFDHDPPGTRKWWRVRRLTCDLDL